ncbi:MAG: hypothetical protein ACRYFU_02485 [Janthinobacterium lividum]
MIVFTMEEKTEVPIRAAERLAHEVLTTAIKASDTATVTETAGLLGQLSYQSTLAKSVADAQSYALLSSDQQARYTQLESQASNSGFAGRSGAGGPPPR